MVAAWATVDDLPSSTAPMHAPTQWGVYLQLATDVLWAAAGRQWRGEESTATAVLRATPPRPGETWGYHRSWGACPCSRVPDWVSATAADHVWPESVRLPHPDVTGVDEVTLDSASFTGWRWDGAWLTRTDGQPWPMCGERVTVTYRHGKLPPESARHMCVILAVELGKAAAGDACDEPCRLPQRLQSVSRQGLTFDQAPELDRMEFLDKGRTGIYEIDLWLASVNPRGRAQRAQVWSPEIVRARRTS